MDEFRSAAAAAALWTDETLDILGRCREDSASPALCVLIGLELL